MFLVAVTGGIACGKTKVCEVFQKHYDVAVVNADAISRESEENF
jgi:dephospho-CoA kinase